MSTFHLFAHLPSELRSRIWELSIEPRDVVLRHDLSEPPKWFSPTPALAAMQVCRESYSTIQGFYEKAFVHDGVPRSDSEQYIRVNFEIDTIRVTQSAPPPLTKAPEAAKVRKLTVELWDDEYFWPGEYRRKAESQYLAEFASLEILTIVYMQTAMRIDPCWLDEFYDLMAEYYYTCIPVPFETRVVHADPLNEGLTRDNFVQKDYEENRLSWEDGREFREDPDEPFTGTNTFSWTHVGCDCKEAAGRWRFRAAPSWHPM